MQKIILYFLLVLLFDYQAPAQNVQRPADAKTKSWYKACYQISADTAYVWLQQNAINFSYLETLQPLVVLPDSVSNDSAKLPIGQYIWVNTNYEKIDAYWNQITHLSTTIFHDGLQRKMLLYNLNGQPIANSQVWLDKNKKSFTSGDGSYLISQKKWKENEEHLIKIATPKRYCIFYSRKR